MIRPTIWIATNNKSKIKEFREILINYHVKSLNDLNEKLEIIEDGKSFAENALIKARVLSKIVQQPVIADDSGLEITALNNFPGIYSARWMEPKTNDFQIINKEILNKMINITNRKCQYICALAYVDINNGLEKVFYGELEGLINDVPLGENGFGYDRIFFLPDLQKTCAQLLNYEKNKISHRFQASKKLLEFLNSIIATPKKINIVLFEPEIAGNVGTIMRTCVAANAKLHLIQPFGFILDHRFLARASANYWYYLDYQLYHSWSQFQELNPNSQLYFATRYGKKSPSCIDFTEVKEQIFIIFGKESKGVPKNILKNNYDNCMRLPMSQYVRSLNLANTVSIILYEVLRQYNYLDLSLTEIQNGQDYLNK